jgi:hypothetical protein
MVQSLHFGFLGKKIDQRNPFLRLTCDLQLQDLTLQTFGSNQGCASFEAAGRKLELVT